MILQVNRVKEGKHSTLSEIYLAGRLIAYGLEDSVREHKIPSQTAIPAGGYKLGLNQHGAMNSRYKRDYPNLHRGMLEIKQIPNYSYVYIHKGNTHIHTAGCLLVGNSFVFVDGDYELRHSAKAYKMLYTLLLEAIQKGEVKIHIDNTFRQSADTQTAKP